MTRPRSQGQIALAFMEPPVPATAASPASIDAAVGVVAADYRLQMQAYALAVQTLIPGDVQSIDVTLHFLDPNVEFRLPLELLDRDVCERAIDEAMLEIVSSSQPEDFPVHPSPHCRVCNFLRVCTAGRSWLKA
jgi:CRISPR/Cas system-associated exonuclease Cas4 (RecB family)